MDTQKAKLYSPRSVLYGLRLRTFRLIMSRYTLKSATVGKMVALAHRWTGSQECQWAGLFLPVYVTYLFLLFQLQDIGGKKIGDVTIS